MSRCLIYKVHTAHQRRAFILPHRFAFVKNFFQVFLNFFVPSSVARCGLLLPQRFHILPHFPGLVKYFFRLFSKSFSYPLPCSAFHRVLSDSFDRLPLSALFVKQFFEFFQSFFLHPISPQYLRSATAFSHKMCPSSFSFQKPSQLSTAEKGGQPPALDSLPGPAGNSNLPHSLLPGRGTTPLLFQSAPLPMGSRAGLLQKAALPP